MGPDTLKPSVCGNPGNVAAMLGRCNMLVPFAAEGETGEIGDEEFGELVETVPFSSQVD